MMPPLGDPAPHGERGLVATPVGHATVQLGDGEPGVDEAGADELVILVDEQTGGEEVGSVGQALLEGLEETDAPRSSADEEDVAGLELLGRAVDDLRPDAHLDLATDLEEERPWSVDDRDGRDLGGPVPLLVLAGDAVRGPSPPRSSGSSSNREEKRLEGIGLGHELGSVDRSDAGRRMPTAARRRRVDRNRAGRRQVRPRTSSLPQWSRVRPDLVDHPRASRLPTAEPRVRTSRFSDSPDSRRCQSHGDGSPIMRPAEPRPLAVQTSDRADREVPDLVVVGVAAQRSRAGHARRSGSS